MPYEAVSRALAYVSCLTTMSLFATSMAIAAVNVGSGRSAGGCPSSACTAQVQKPPGMAKGSLTSKARVEAAASTIQAKKI